MRRMLGVLALLAACADEAAEVAPSVSTERSDAAVEDAGRSSDAASEHDTAMTLEPAVRHRTPVRARWLEEQRPEPEAIDERDQFDPDELYILLDWRSLDGQQDFGIAPWDRPGEARFSVRIESWGVAAIDPVTHELVYAAEEDREHVGLRRFRSEDGPLAIDAEANDRVVALIACPPDDEGATRRGIVHMAPDTGTLIHECIGRFEHRPRYFTETGQEVGTGSPYSRLLSIGYDGLTLWNAGSAYLIDRDGYATQATEPVFGDWARPIEDGFMFALSIVRPVIDDYSEIATYVELVTLRDDASVTRERFPEIIQEGTAITQCALRGKQEVLCVDIATHITDDPLEIVYYRHFIGRGEMTIERVPLPSVAGGTVQLWSFVQPP